MEMNSGSIFTLLPKTTGVTRGAATHRPGAGCMAAGSMAFDQAARAGERREHARRGFARPLALFWGARFASVLSLGVRALDRGVGRPDTLQDQNRGEREQQKT